MQRRTHYQTLSWFWDLFQRERLVLDPPYQRRSIWNESYKKFFINTVLRNYPCPAIFLFEDIATDGSATYSVVDGKQRLTTIFEFIQNEFAAPKSAGTGSEEETYFKDLSEDEKRNFWRYQFAVEYVPTENETLITEIFDRINRNVAQLTRQELRHAKFNGEFISDVEELTEWMADRLPRGFPQIATQSRRQMRDSELIGLLLLLLENGPQSLSQDDVDAAYSSRDQHWETRADTVERFRQAIQVVQQTLESQPSILQSRLRNQVDFYSFIGAIDEIGREGAVIDPSSAGERLEAFLRAVASADERLANPLVREYYDAARSASNDERPRRQRIQIVKGILMGTVQIG